MDPRKQRGFLNNNCGNMDRAVGEPWQGEIRDKDDPRLTDFQRNELVTGRFCVFATPEYGIRAMVRNLQAYQRAGWTNVATMIDHWAPPNENDTSAYKASVCSSIGTTPYAPIDMTAYAPAYAMVDAITRVECGGMPYSGREIENGLRLAGIVKVSNVSNSATMQGVATVSASTMAQPLLASVQDPIQNVIDTMAPLSDASQYVQWAMIAGKVLLGAIALYGVYMIYRERKMHEQRDAAVAQAQVVGL